MMQSRGGRSMLERFDSIRIQANEWKSSQVGEGDVDVERRGDERNLNA